MTEVSIVGFERDETAHAEGVAALCRNLGWPSYSDPAVALQGCGGPGVTTMVALVAGPDLCSEGDRNVNENGDARVVGFAQVLGDGVVHGYLAQLGVLASHRRQGIATLLVEAAFTASGVQRLDLLTDDAEQFYSGFAHRTRRGYRLYPATPVMSRGRA